MLVNSCYNNKKLIVDDQDFYSVGDIRDVPRMIKNLNKDLTVSSWSSSVGTQVNPDKTRIIIFGSVNNFKLSEQIQLPLGVLKCPCFEE